MDRDVAPWWSPREIARQEATIRESQDSSQMDVRNDFASYRALAEGQDPISAGLHLHNPYEPIHVGALCRDYVNVVRRELRVEPARIADLGCGAGFTTAEIKRTWAKAEVVGVDVSQDAIRFAQSAWSECRFEARAIDPEARLSDTGFDVLLCQEFYPFTRTDSLGEHKIWMKFLLNNLDSDGIAVVTVSSANKDSINATYKRLKGSFDVRRMVLATPRISRRVPFGVSLALGTIMSRIAPVRARSVYVLRKQSGLEDTVRVFN